MSDTLPASTARGSSVPARIGLVVAALLVVADVFTWIPQYGDGGPVLPTAVLLVAALTLVAIPYAWAGRRWAKITVSVTRVLSSLTGMPVYFIPDIPPQAVLMVSIGIGLAVIVSVLLFVGPRQAR
jgi:hypothetical protein